jgi:copper(I)-binding protein
VPRIHVISRVARRGVSTLETTMRIPAALLALSLAFGGSAAAHDYSAGPIKIDHPWSRATPKGASVAGGYMKITNTGTTPDRLIGGSVEAARRFEIHEMSMEGGVMKMREMPKGVEIAPGATVELKPGGYHVMMMNLSKQFMQGDKVKGTLTFEKAGKIDVEFAVEAVGGAPQGHGAPSGAKGGHKH